jgi:hypothetical protein
MRLTKADIPPIHEEGFWSLSMYDKEYFLVPNLLDRHALGSHHTLNSDLDGSIELFIQRESPGPERETNWLPAPDGEFILMMRLYWPKDEALDGTWAPPAVGRID